MKKIEYQEEGVVRDTIQAMIGLFVGIGAIVLVIILVSVIGAKAQSVTQDDISAVVVDANTIVAASDQNHVLGLGIQSDINSSIVNSFGGLNDAAGFLSIIILAVVFFLVLVLLSSGMQPFGGGGASAL